MNLVLRISLFITLLWHLENCEAKKKHRIIDGRPADIEEFPYQVSLEQGGRHFCGGSIVHKQIILTAAHCAEHLTSFTNIDPKKMIVRVGSSLSRAGGVLHTVSQVVPHEKYVDTAPVDKYDIALVLLVTPIEFNDKAQRIKLPIGPPREGMFGWVTGYGNQVKSLHRTGFTSKPLMAIEIPIVDTDRCRVQMRRLGGIVARDMFCAGHTEGHKDACRGDSGGPFQSNGILYGIVAWGIGCGNEGVPGIYTGLHNYKKWLQKTSEKLLKGVESTSTYYTK